MNPPSPKARYSEPSGYPDEGPAAHPRDSEYLVPWLELPLILPTHHSPLTTHHSPLTTHHSNSKLKTQNSKLKPRYPAARPTNGLSVLLASARVILSRSQGWPSQRV